MGLQMLEAVQRGLGGKQEQCTSDGYTERGYSSREVYDVRVVSCDISPRLQICELSL